MHSFENLAFLRGTSAAWPTDRPYLNKPRSSRIPRDTPRELHLAADEWFRKRFGVAHRSQSIFLTSQMVVAASYAKSPDHVVRVIPIGQYKYCWSRKTSDLLSILKRLDGPDAVERTLDGAEYTDDDLATAHSYGHEVMLHCESYIAIPVGLIEPQKTEERPKVILLK